MKDLEEVKKKIDPLTEALNKCKQAFIITFMFAFAVNVLNLITPLYSLQVLDRVLSSRSLETLLMLSLVMIAVYIVLHLLQVVRAFVLIKIGEWLHSRMTPILFANSVANAAVRPSIGGSQSLRDLATVKSFLTSSGINTLFDAPWSIIYVLVVFLIHPYLGWLTIFGGIIIFCFAVFNAYSTNNQLSKATESNIKSMNQAEIANRNAEAIEAMGMMKHLVKNWYKASEQSMKLQSHASYRNGVISNISKFIRVSLQMAVTGIGAYLTLKNEMTVGGMIASSIIVGRALAPFDQAIAVWKSVTDSKVAFERLKKSFDHTPVRSQDMKLPVPQGILTFENVFFAHPPRTQAEQTNPKHVVKGVSFGLEAGDVLAIIGPSAAGKSSMAKLMMGVWKPSAGSIRLDGAEIYSWNRENFGQYVGYLPQAIELFSGTIKENIARLNQDASSEDIVEAAQIAGAHDMILRLPNGYDTDIGVAGASLSGGQKQRIGLARAFFGNPRFVVLDEPNANLDETGEAALVQAILKAKEKKITTVIISHRTSILSSVDKILVLQDGSIAAFGSREEIIARISGTNQ